MPDRMSLEQIGANEELRDILIRHAYRGVRIQVALRALLVVFMTLTLAFVPPADDVAASWLIVAAYAVWAAAVAVWAFHGGLGPVRWTWLALLVDALAITVLTVVAGISAEQTWTADLLVNGFFIIPMLAAAQLRPRICAIVVVPTTGAYLLASILTKTANTEPWSSIFLRTLVLAGVGATCIALSWVQLSRVLTIAGLVGVRTELLTELVGIEARERAHLAEQLHDGALQYVLAARQDLEDARELADPGAFARLDHALRESSAMLRSTVSELHPAVLERAGLARAIQDLATAVAERGDLAVEVDVSEWRDEPTTADALLYSAAREMLSNVARHARASEVTLTLRRCEQAAQLQIVDDGQGIADGVLARRLADGHIGLASQRTRIVAAGGQLAIEAAVPCGTAVTIRLPLG